MRICLYWNENAGRGISLADISALIVKAGHTLECVVERPADLPDKFDASIDCVVAAGGDGTVARAGRALAGGEIPLAILPLGTANNIASSLGIAGPPEQAIAAWKDQKIVRIDMGVVRDANGESRFLESVGAGLVVAGITEGRAAIPEGGDPTDNVAQARQLYVDISQRLQPRRYGITIDGTAMAGEYLLLEVQNIPSVGPGMILSGEVNAADGLLSVVLAGEADREAVTSYLKARLTGEPSHAGLKSWRASQVELRDLQEFHVDDDVRATPGSAVTIGIRPASLVVMA